MSGINDRKSVCHGIDPGMMVDIPGNVGICSFFYCQADLTLAGTRTHGDTLHHPILIAKDLDMGESKGIPHTLCQIINTDRLRQFAQTTDAPAILRRGDFQSLDIHKA